jgi:predicted metal-dependent hydrolase
MPEDISDLNIETIRTNRKKTASIRLRDGQVQIVVPNRMSQRRINEIIRSKAQWIRKAVVADAQKPSYQPKTYLEGEVFTFLGQNYSLNFVGEPIGWPTISGEQLMVTKGEPAAVKAQIDAWYMRSATQLLMDRTAHFGPLMAAEPANIKVKNYKSRWGACSANGDLTYNWRITLAPAPIVDYVVVHELAHLHHHDHSPRFWGCVEETMPDYKVRNRWLKENGTSLRAD